MKSGFRLSKLEIFEAIENVNCRNDAVEEQFEDHVLLHFSFLLYIHP